MGGDPLTVEGNESMAAAYEEAGQALRTFRYDRVFALMNELLQHHAEASEPFVYIARANLRLGAPQEAVDALQEAIRRDAGNRLAHAILCFMLGLRGDDEAAAREFAAAMASTPDAAVCQWCADFLIEAGELMGALAYAEEAVALEPANPELYELLGRIYMYMGQPEPGIQMFRQALWLGPGDAVTMNNIGVLLLHMGNRADAFEYFWKALQVAPGFTTARRNVWFTARSKHPIFAWAWYCLIQFVQGAPNAIPLVLTVLCMAKAVMKTGLFWYPPLAPLSSLFCLLTLGFFCVEPVLNFVLKRGWIRFLR